jgi:hypothetical protein
MSSNRSWPEQPKHLILFRHSERCTVLGPGARAVLWVQGCPFTCPGCVVLESLPFAGGTSYPVESLASWIVDNSGIDGVTLSGGEPMSQAAGLCDLIDGVRDRRNLSFMSYTGHTTERYSFLARLDGLIFLLDPLRMPGVRERLPGRVRVRNENGLSETHSVLGNLLNLDARLGRHLARLPFSVALTKTDELRSLVYPGVRFLRRSHHYLTRRAGHP